jgi:hypothetical protein
MGALMNGRVEIFAAPQPLAFAKIGAHARADTIAFSVSVLLYYYACDLLRLNVRDVRKWPLSGERKN